MSKKGDYVSDLMGIEKEFPGIEFVNISKDPHLPVYQAELGSIIFTCIPSSLLQSKNQYFLGGKYCTATQGFDSKEGIISAAYKLIKNAYVDLRLFNEYQRKQIMKGIGSGVDVRLYGNPELSEDQMELLREGLELGFPIQCYNSAQFSLGQMYEIQQGFKENINASMYLTTAFDAKQMVEIRAGLKEGLDISLYANPEFDYFQMRIIKAGLEKGLDVRQYADPRYDLGEMAKIYHRLERESRSIDRMIQAANSREGKNTGREGKKIVEKKEFEMSM